MSNLTPVDIKVDHVYRAKRPSAVGFPPLMNDRQVVFIEQFGKRLQYDSPTVAIGRRLPWISVEDFLSWAHSDITDSMPVYGEWRSPPVKGD